MARREGGKKNRLIMLSCRHQTTSHHCTRNKPVPGKEKKRLPVVANYGLIQPIHLN